MTRLKLVIEYDGTHYHGWQRQKIYSTVQQTLEETFEKITKQPVKVIGTSRTDSGVHAMGQMAHCELPSRIKLTHATLLKALNSLLPKDISIKKLQSVSSHFHAQKNVHSKKYTYQILNSPAPSALLRNRSWWIASPLDIKKMNEASKLIVGEHNFKAFQNQGTKLSTSIRHIYQSDFKKKSPFVLYEVEGNGFLKQMVRNLVSAFVDIGKGKIKLEEFKMLLESKNRHLCPPPAPPQGLFLTKVTFRKTKSVTCLLQNAKDVPLTFEA